jgi:hypothetical protein
MTGAARSGVMEKKLPIEVVMASAQPKPDFDRRRSSPS